MIMVTAMRMFATRLGGVTARLLVLGLAAAGCATTPKPADIRTAVTEDAQLKNDYIEIQGRVRDYEEPQGDTVRTWRFALEDAAGNRLPVYVDDRDAEAVAEANRLVEAAQRADEPVTATGYLRTGRYHNVSSGPRLDLRAVRYRDERVELGRRSDWDDSPSVHFGIGYYGQFH